MVGKDKRLQVGHAMDLVNDSEAMDLWRGNDVASRVVETIPNESFRQGFEIKAGDKELSEDVTAQAEELNVTAAFLKATKYERAYGGSAIFPVINDSQANLALPLNLKQIAAIDHLLVFEPRELQPIDYYNSPTDKKFGEPKTYRVIPTTLGGSPSSMFNIHESRLIIFPGIRASRIQTNGNGWGDSVLNRVRQILGDYGIAWSAVAVLLHEFSHASFKIKGLSTLLANDRDDVIQTRIRAAQLSRSTINATLMDSEEEYERKQTPVNGLAELLASFATRLAAAADMPVTLLMGQSPAGLNATGESDVRFFYDRVNAKRTLEYLPKLEQMVKLMLLANGGPTKGKEPDVWSVKFNPLWQPSEKEVAETRKVVADTDAVLITSGMASPEELALSRFGGDKYSMETVIDFDERAKLMEGEGEAEPVDGEAEGEVAIGGAKGQENVAATAMNGAQVSSLVDVVVKAAAGEISRESAKAILTVAFPVTPVQAESLLGPKDFEPVKPEPPPNPFGGVEPPPDDPDGEKSGKEPSTPGEKAEKPASDEEEDPEPARADGGPGSGPQGGQNKTLHLKEVTPGAKDAFRTRNLQKETGLTPAKIRQALAKAGVPGPKEGKVWWFHKDDKQTIIDIIKNGGKLPEGHTDVKVGDDAKGIGTTKEAVAAAADKLSAGGAFDWSNPEAESIRDIAKGKVSPLKDTGKAQLPPPPPSMSAHQLVADVPQLPQSVFSAVKAYTGSAYMNINGHLRNGPPPDEGVRIAKMDKAFTAMEEKGGLSGGVVAYRGMSFSGLQKQLDGAPVVPGMVIRDKGYISTSITKDYGKERAVSFEINVPPGSRAIYVAHFSNYKAEKELLLNRGSAMRVTHVEVKSDKFGNKKTHIKADLVQD